LRVRSAIRSVLLKALTAAMVPTGAGNGRRAEISR
jgi:hypothetical protein